MPDVTRQKQNLLEKGIVPHVGGSGSVLRPHRRWAFRNTSPPGMSFPRHPNDCRLRAGHVVEVHIERLADVDDLQALTIQVFAAMERCRPAAVVCTDCRATAPLGRHVARVWAGTLRKANRHVVRSAFLLDPANAVFNLQLERIVRCAIHPERRCFTELDALHEWVGGALSELERQAVRPLFSGDD